MSHPRCLQVLLAAADREWVTRSSPRLEFWEGDATELQEVGSTMAEWRP